METLGSLQGNKMKIHETDLDLLSSLGKLKNHIKLCSEDMQDVFEDMEE